MTQISVWGPLTWYFFHTLAEKIKDEHYPKMKSTILSLITAFCTHLPCDDCSMHASDIMKRVTTANIDTKADLQLFLFNFHNKVSGRIEKQIFTKSILDKYKTAVLPAIVNNLYNVFHTRDKKYMMNEFNRKIMLNNNRGVIQDLLNHCDR